MTLGEKIKLARIKKKLTQADICKSDITRNMLSLIERGHATPSVDTLKLLAERLELPLPYLLTEEDDLLFFQKRERMPLIRAALEAKNYTVAISHIMKLDGSDDELAYLLALCYFELGVASVKNGSLQSAARYLSLSRDFAARTLYDTTRFECIIPMYLAIARNVSAPLLEFGDVDYEKSVNDTTDYEFYKYFIHDFSYEFSDFRMKTHMKAKILIKERRYADAIVKLSEIEAKKSEYGHNAFITFGVYSDLEICYKQLFDFENAYRYASKRLSLIEGFQS